MTEQPQPQEKQYKQTPKQRAYFRDRRRRNLMANKKCDVCGGQATTRLLITQKLYCDKDLPVVSEITKLPRIEQQILALKASVAFKDLGESLNKLLGVTQ
jgi:hypothetical protein